MKLLHVIVIRQSSTGEAFAHSAYVDPNVAQSMKKQLFPEENNASIIEDGVTITGKVGIDTVPFIGEFANENKGTNCSGHGVYT